MGHQKNTQQKLIVAPEPFALSRRRGDGQGRHAVTRALLMAGFAGVAELRCGGLGCCGARVSPAALAPSLPTRLAACKCLQLGGEGGGAAGTELLGTVICSHQA